jgi:hypothetical protein
MVTETWSTFNCVKPFSECSEKKSWYEALRKERTRPSRGTAGSEKYLAPGGAKKNNLTRGSALVLQVAVCWNSQMQLRKKTLG